MEQTTKKPNRVWLELERDPDDKVNVARAELASRMLKALGVMTTTPVWWNERKQHYCFTVDMGGSFVEANDHGHWYSLDFLGRDPSLTMKSDRGQDVGLSAPLPALDPVTVNLADGKQLERRTFAVPLGDGAVTHQWYLDGVPITGETSPSFGGEPCIVVFNNTPAETYPAHDTTIPEIEAAMAKVWRDERVNPTKVIFDDAHKVGGIAVGVPRPDTVAAMLDAREGRTTKVTDVDALMADLNDDGAIRNTDDPRHPDCTTAPPESNTLNQDASLIGSAVGSELGPIPTTGIPSLDDCEDPLTDAIADSLDIDWSPRDGAKAILREFWFQTLINVAAKGAALAPQVIELQERCNRLRGFKDYVHARLDQAGIETHPDGPHSNAGCRVGDRLDIVLQMHEQGGDLAVAIGEHAFRAGCAAFENKARAATVDDLWDAYDPPEDLKGGGFDGARSVRAVAREFVDRCDRGEVRSKRSYAAFKAALGIV